MPTDYDDFSKSAHVDADGVLADRAANAQKLRKSKECRGFRSFATEWWKNATSLHNQRRSC
ncbi:MAG: M15 family metallopeptidase [Synechococcus sp. ChBW.bin.23]